MDHKNRNEEQCNLPPEEINALRELVRLQREWIITIKACDKGAGIIILDFNSYMKACYNHLLSNQPGQYDQEGTLKYYQKEDDFAADKAKNHINATPKRALEEKIISKEEYKAMDPDDKKPFKFLL